MSRDALALARRTRTPTGSPSHSSRATCSRRSTARSISSSRTRRTSAPASSTRSSRKSATGSRAARSSTTARRRARGRGARRTSTAALVLEVHAEPGRRVAARSRAPATTACTITRDLAGRERVVEGRWDEPRRSQRCAPAGRCSSRPTPSTGSCSLPTEAAVDRALRAQGPPPEQPTALVAATSSSCSRPFPSSSRRSSPGPAGPYTLVLPNPARRFRWLTGASPDTIGVRVPALRRAAARPRSCRLHRGDECERPGGPDPRTLDDVPERLRDGCARRSTGPLPGTPSTVVDLTGAEPRGPARRRRARGRGDRKASGAASTIRVMAVAQQTFEELRGARARRDRP